MLYLFLSLFSSQFLLVTPCAIKNKQEENREGAPFLEVNNTISESPDSKKTDAPWTNVDFTPRKGQQKVDTCRRVSMFVSFHRLGLSDDIIAPSGFSAFQCKGKCSSTQRTKFSNRSPLMALIEKKKGIKLDDEVCCVPTKLTPISVIVY